MTAGRPTDYKAEYCEQLIEHGKSGRSWASFASSIGIGRSTFYNWITPDSEGFQQEFLDAYEIAKAHALAYYEEIAIEGLMESGLPGDPKVAWPGIKFLMENRFREDYGRRQTVEHTGPIPVHVTEDESEV